MFKNGPSKICGKQPLKNFTWSILEYLDPFIAEFEHIIDFRDVFFDALRNIKPKAVMVFTNVELSFRQDLWEYSDRKMFPDFTDLKLVYRNLTLWPSRQLHVKS